MNTKNHALDLALEALEESVDLVREDYENAKKLYGNYPSRQARLLGMEDGLLKHEAAITAIKQSRSAPYVASPLVQDKCFLCGERVESCTSTVCPKATQPGGRQSEDCLTAAQRPVAEPHKWVHATEWRGLTDEEMYLNCPNWLSQEHCKTWVQQIEAKLKAKNFA